MGNSTSNNMGNSNLNNSYNMWISNSNNLNDINFKLKSNDSNKVYSNIFSLENIISINKYFKQFYSLDD